MWAKKKADKETAAAREEAEKRERTKRLEVRRDRSSRTNAKRFGCACFFLVCWPSPARLSFFGGGGAPPKATER